MQICIVGPNGAGKSTLMNLVAGDLEPVEGEARRSRRLRIGRYAQHFVDALAMDETPVEYLMATYGAQRKEDGTELKEYDVRAMLGKFGLAGHHHHQARSPVFLSYNSRSLLLVPFLALGLSPRCFLWRLMGPLPHRRARLIGRTCACETTTMRLRCCACATVFTTSTHEACSRSSS